MIYKRSGVILPHPDNVEALAECWAEHFVKKSDVKVSKRAFIDTYRKMRNRNPDLAA